MTQYASLYLRHPANGLLKLQIVEVEQGRYVCHFDLTEEQEHVIWLPGLIELQASANGTLVPFHLYPYDFANGQPFAGTQRTPLL